MARADSSPLWHRVAGLRPRLRGHARIHRHEYRGEIWYILQNPVSRRMYRFNPPAYQFIGLLDGRHSVQEARDLAFAQLGEEGPTQDETIRLLAQLHQADLLQTELAPDVGELLRRVRQQRLRRWLQLLLSPLAMRFPLLDPEALLARALPAFRPLFTWYGFVLWAAVVAFGLSLAGVHWRGLTENLSDRVLAPQNLVIVLLLFPLIKALHELGHACATRAWGGEVHEMGVMLLVLLPIPYVDASASSAFPETRRRLVVGAAGMMVELFLASLAMVAWVLMEPGMLRAAMFNVLLIAGISTVVFNGNPLLRFDGYYMLADAIEIPNLGQRAVRELAYLGQRWLLGMKDATPVQASRSERVWLAVYGVASFCYRLLVILGIALFIGAQYFFFGALLAIWAVITSIVLPIARSALYVLRLDRAAQDGHDPRLRAGAIAAGVIAVLALAPFPLWTRTEGVIWVAERAQLRAGADGFVQKVLVAPGDRVEPGQPIAELDDPVLRARLRGVEARMEELEARFFAQLAENRAQAEKVREEMAAARADLERHRERVRALTLRAEAPGEVVVPRHEDLPGRYIRQGEVLGYVVSPALVIARAIVPQERVDLVRTSTRAVHIRLASRIARVEPSEIRGEVPAASGRLPGLALAIAGGGAVTPDPRDPRGATALQRHFEFELALPALPPGIGERVYVRFDHGYAPLAWQGYRALRQLFLSSFNV